MYCVWSHPWRDGGRLPTHKWWYCLQIIAPLSEKSLNFSLRNGYILLGDAVVPVRDVWVGTEPRCAAGKPSQLCRDARLGTSQQFPFVCLDGDFRQRCKCPVTPVPLACSYCGTGSCGFWWCQLSPCTQWGENHGLVGNCSRSFG